jgi:hypothetical protein
MHSLPPMVSTYVIDVLHAFEDTLLSVRRNDVLVWRADEICHLRLFRSGEFQRWWYPSNTHTLVLIHHEGRLAFRDPIHPPMIELARVANGMLRGPRPSRPTDVRLHLLK